VVNLKVWIDDIVIYHSKIEQKATPSSMNKLYEMAALRRNFYIGVTRKTKGGR